MNMCLGNITLSTKLAT